MRSIARLFLSALIIASAACASSGAGRSQSNRDEISQAEIRAQSYTDAYQIVEALRSNWLRVRGTDSFQQPTQILVYLDDSRLGGVETLRGLSPQSISYMRHYDAVSATARWGLGHGQGVIYVSSRPKQ